MSIAAMRLMKPGGINKNGLRINLKFCLVSSFIVNTV